MHAAINYQTKLEKQDKQILTLLKVFNRLSDNYRDFLCICMQQRFTKNEMKKYQITTVASSNELRLH